MKLTMRTTGCGFLVLLLCGCSQSVPSTPPNTAATASASPAADSDPGSTAPTENPAATDPAAPPRRGPVSLGASAPTESSNDTAPAATDDESVASIMAALKPLQVLMGTWDGKTRKQFEGFSAVDEPKWVWDLLTDKKHPALVMASEKSPYFRKVRVTFDTAAQKYLMTSEHPTEGNRKFVGEFVKPAEDVAVDDDTRLQRTFQLQFTQTEPADAKEQWRITFNQQRNDRYLVEMERKRGNASFFQFDVVASQRQGTSFALSDSDYGEKTCIVSGGLGTTTVSFMGKTYYVCCSGCDAAFKAEPQRWIDKAMADAKAKP